MPYTLELSENFNRTNTGFGSGADSAGSPTVGLGTGWTGNLGDFWRIQSNKAVTDTNQNPTDVLVGGAYNTGYSFAEGRVTLTGTTNHAAALLGYDPVTDTGYAGLAYGEGTSIFLYRRVSGTTMTLVSNLSTPGATPNGAVHVFDRKSIGDTVVLSYKKYDANDLVTPVFSTEYEDSTAERITAAGRWGIGSYGGDTTIDSLTLESYSPVGPIEPGTASLVYVTTTTASISATSAAGGVGTISKQWQRRTGGSGSFTDVSGATGNTLLDTALTPGTLYQYRQQLTDEAASVDYTNNLSVTAYSEDSIRPGFIGDSNTASPHTGAPTMVSVLQGLDYEVAPEINMAVPGSSTYDWQEGQTYFNNAVTQYNLKQVNYIFVSLGTNNSYRNVGGETTGTPQATYSAHMAAMVAALFEAVETLQYVILNDVAYNYATNDNPNIVLGDSAVRVTSYNTALTALDNTTTIRRGDTTLYTYTSTSPATKMGEEENGDLIHWSEATDTFAGMAWATAFDSLVFLPPVGPTEIPTITLSQIVGGYNVVTSDPPDNATVKVFRDGELIGEDSSIDDTEVEGGGEQPVYTAYFTRGDGLNGPTATATFFASTGGSGRKSLTLLHRRCKCR